jgi:predicted nucleotidyltransferase
VILNQEIQSRLPEMQDLFKRYGVTCASLFGSCLKDRFSGSSDVDVLVEFDFQMDPIDKGTALLALESDLEHLLHRKVDLVSYSAIRNPYFLSEVNETRLIVYNTCLASDKG